MGNSITPDSFLKKSPKTEITPDSFLGVSSDTPNLSKQNEVIDKIQQDNPEFPKWMGFTPENVAKNAWQGAKDLASGTFQFGKDVVENPNWFTGKDSTLSKFIDKPSENEVIRAGEKLNTGHPIQAYGHSLASVVPLVGPWAANLGEQSGKGDIGGATGNVLGTLGLGKLSGVASDVIKSKVGNIIHPTPEILNEKVTKHLTNALNPVKSNAKYLPALKGSLNSGDLASAIQDAKIPDANGKPGTEPLNIQDHTDYKEAITQRKNALWDEIKPKLKLAGNDLIDKSRTLADLQSTRSGISAKIEPNSYKPSESETFYSNNTPLKIDDAQERVQDLNKQLNAFFKAPVSASEVEATAPKIANKLAERASLNSQIDEAVEKATGQGIGDFKKRYSNLRQHEEDALRAQITSETKKNPGFARAITPYMGGKVLLGLGALLTGHPEVGMGALGLGTAESGMRLGLGKLQSPEYNLNKAVNILKGMPKAAISSTPAPIPPSPFNPKGLLPSGVNPPAQMTQQGAPTNAVGTPPTPPIGPIIVPPSPLEQAYGSESTPTGGARGFTSDAQPDFRFAGRSTAIPSPIQVPSYMQHERMLPPQGSIQVPPSSLPQSLAVRDNTLPQVASPQAAQSGQTETSPSVAPPSTSGPKQIVESSGLKFDGIQSDHIWYTDPKTGSTGAIKVDEFNEQKLKDNIDKSRKRFDDSKK